MHRTARDSRLKSPVGQLTSFKTLLKAHISPMLFSHERRGIMQLQAYDFGELYTDELSFERRQFSFLFLIFCFDVRFQICVVLLRFSFAGHICNLNGQID